ncbi:MAG: SDR family oxidoreductase [Microcoleus sp. SIO2G3]|nr:SDR family oxidoreductase [Microcoleus sp. SIO2G3]
MTSSIHRHALITGAGSGIGQATAIAFAQSGFDLVLVGRSIDKLETTAAKIKSFGVSAQSVAIDLADVATLKAKLQAIDVPIDVLINNAGMGYTNSLLDTSLEDWQRVMTLNLTSVFQCIQAIVPQMRDRKRGTIVNVASIAAANAFPGWGAYSVSKAALVALSKTLAVEERSHGIRVVAISPGSVNTPIWDTDTVQADFDRAQMLTPDMVAQTILHTVLLPAQAVIEELTIMPSAGAL